jgi:outer membrane protein
MLKKLCILAVLSVSSISFAAGIAVIDIDKVRMDTKAGQSIAQQLTDLQNTLNDQFIKTRQDFDKKKQELDKQKTVLSQEAFAKKEADFNNKLGDFRKDLQKEAANLEQMQQVALEDFNLVARDIIDNIAKESKYSQIFPAAVMVYADPKSDITNQVIVAIDKKIDRIALKTPVAAAPAK